MTQFSWNNLYLTRDGKPWTPTMGEFHFHRYPECDWDREIRKMKAGGIDIVTTYVFWYAHEPEEGQFIFDGRYNLRKFIELCADAGVYVIVRFGPWCHGEARLGGMPKWMHQRGFVPRTMDDRYFAYVKKFWEKVYEHCKGLEIKDNGPIVAYQMDNEFGHCGGEGGDAHIDRLYDLAREIGFDAPYYTATGWGGAFIGSHCLPIMGGYEDAPWDPSIEKLPPNENYVFSHVRNDAGIGSDFGEGLGLSFDKELYPFITCELGGGLMPTYNRRPVVSGKDAGAMAMVKMGNGANVLGYYMYHGGTNPRPDMQESRVGGDYCELPEYSYDFQAPLGEYGYVNPPYYELKLLAMFNRDFAEELAPTVPVLVEGAARSAAELDKVNYAYRIKDGSGFLFVNNHQRIYTRAPQTFTPEVPGVSFPEIHVEDGDFGFYPFNLKTPSGLIRTALATPLCKLNGSTYVFYTDKDPMYDTEGDIDIITLSRADALNAYKINFQGMERLVISPVPVVEEKEGFSLTAKEPVRIRVIPALNTVPSTLKEVAPGEYETLTAVPACPSVKMERVSRNPLMEEYRVTVDGYAENAETFLSVNYRACMAEIHVDGKKTADNFCTGTGWNLSLSRLGNPGEFMLRVFALSDTMPVYVEFETNFRNRFLLELDAPVASSWVTTYVK